MSNVISTERTLLLIAALTMMVMTLNPSIAVPVHAVNCNGQSLSEGIPHPNGGGVLLGDAQVEDSVYIGHKAVICGGTITGNVIVKGRSVIVNAIVSDNVFIRNSLIHRATVSGNARIIEGAVWSGAMVYGNARILNGASVRGAGARVYGNAKVVGFDTNILGHGEVYGSAFVRDGANISGKVDCGRWVGVTVTTDQTGKCGMNGRGIAESVLSNPISEMNTESE